MPHANTEDQLVEQPAIGLFAELGWTTVSALERLNSALPLETRTASMTLLSQRRLEVPGGPVNIEENLGSSGQNYTLQSVVIPSIIR